MDFKRKCLIGVLSWILIVGCSPYNRLRKDFTQGQSTIQYIHTSVPVAVKSDLVIELKKPLITDKRFVSSARVSRDKDEVIPLIIYTGWKYQFNCSLGTPLIKENIPSMLSRSFNEECRRTGNFRLDSVSSSGLSLEIAVDSLHARGPYTNEGFFLYLLFFAATSKTERAGPGEAYSRFHYRLSKEDKIIKEGFVSTTSTGKPIAIKYSFELLHNAYRGSLAESLSETFRINTEKIIRELNRFLQ